MRFPVHVTVHAARRFKQRTGLPQRAARRAATDALKHGTPPDDLPWFYRDRLNSMLKRHTPDGRTFARVRGDVAYVFAPARDTRLEAELVLVTVLPSYEEKAP